MFDDFGQFLTDNGVYPWYEKLMDEYKEGQTYDDWLESVRNSQECYRNFVNYKFYDEFNIETQDLDLQNGNRFKKISSKNKNGESNKLLFRKEHLKYVRKMRRIIYRDNIDNESIRILMVYWSLHSEELLTDDYDELHLIFEEKVYDEETSSNGNSKNSLYSDSEDVIETILRFQDLNGGFGGNFSHMPNMVSTYLAVASLIMTNNSDAILKIDRYKMYQYFKKLRDDETGGFRVQLDGEVDVRAFYCVVAVSSMLHIVTTELFDNIEGYILNCVGFDGGFSGDLDGESHGGYTYCVVAGLCILGKTDILDIDSLLYWITQRQSGIEGGFQGRTNKLVDSCYSFWFLGLLYCIREILRLRCNTSKLPFQHLWCDIQALKSFILICCQLPEGGFIDKPGKPRDLYHTCYALSGLSLAQKMINMFNDSDEKNSRLDINDSLEIPQEYIEICNNYSPFYTLNNNQGDFINPTDPFLNIRPDKIIKSRNLFAKNPIVLTYNGDIGTEGIGYKIYIENRHYLSY